MAGGVVQNQIKTKLNDARLAGPPFSVGVTMGLINGAFVGPVTPAMGDSVLVWEGWVGGYARQPVAGWTPSVLTADDHAAAAAAIVTFTNTSGVAQGVVGFFLYDVTLGHVMMIGLFATPVMIPNGATFPVGPYWTETNE